MIFEELTAEEIIKIACNYHLCDKEGRDSDSIDISYYLTCFAKRIKQRERDLSVQIIKELDHQKYGIYRIIDALNERHKDDD
jgi:hypothetical protein